MDIRAILVPLDLPLVTVLVARELGPVVLNLHGSLKSVFDPHGILNLGKVF